MTLKPPLVAGDRHPQQAAGVRVSTLLIEPVAALPTPAEEGQMVRLLVDNKVWVYLGGAWQVDPTAGGVASHVHEQAAPETTWNITHALGYRPAVTVVDSLGETVFGDVRYQGLNAVTVTFLTPVAGYAYLT